MTHTIYDICGIGNAIVDILAHADEEFIREQNLLKGAMTMIDEERAEELYGLMEGTAKECSGGSAANTMAGIASLGGMPAFIGKVKQDGPGESFRYDMRTIGVHFDTPAQADGKATARCYIFVTPDAQRTMNTYIGACAELTEDDINDALVAHSKITYIEGYLWDTPNAKAAIRKALKVAHDYDRTVAFTLSDIFCVDRHRQDFIELIGSHINILFANENELKSLYQTDNFDRAAEMVRGKCDIAVLTRSEKGSLIVTKDNTIHIEAGKDLDVVDSTGAGDLYASGFLHGFAQGMDLKACGEIATLCASEIIQQIGARPQRPLNQLIQHKNKVKA
ncbi:MAG TPA: adenosine kinase [Rickettsiales bacterium]|nr:adenosine kinase [Rickettsiales bacterium]